MNRWLALGLFLAIALGTSAAAAQEELLVLVVEAGETPINQARLVSAIGTATRREVIRMTDSRAPSARGRLSIAYQRPNRWVLQYEAGGQVAWVADHIERPSDLRPRLAALAASVVTVIDGAPHAVTAQSAQRPTPAAPPPRTRRPRSQSWDEDIILALRDELVDPFAQDAPSGRDRPVALLWSEVVDPFASPSGRGATRQVWSEVLDPWAAEVRRR
ncbi:MAG: hypothetical protein H6719_36955 [Sandaracinaceae bacterium]|nr:hypothetical protein [Sandaracinaceae bacterium]